MVPTRFVLLAAALAAGPAAAAAPAGWTRLADCAAAYRANAAVADPGRAPAMKAMISETADAYLKAAAARLRRQEKRAAAPALEAVRARVAARAAGFGRRPRAEVERFIDACPQPDG